MANNKVEKNKKNDVNKLGKKDRGSKLITRGKEDKPVNRLIKVEKEDNRNKNDNQDKSTDKAIVDQICLESAEEICKKLVSMALRGDFNACKYIVDRARPLRKGTPFKLDLPCKINTAEELDKASARVLNMLANAEISLEESNILYNLFDFRYKTIEMRDISGRLDDVESALKQNGQ